jgi:Ser/Thr protein kinase RdoA (MazF antagonist)
MPSPLDHLSEAERLAAFDGLAANAVAAWDLRPILLQRIACRENAVYAVQVADGGRMALRVHRSGYHDRAALDSELKWMRALAQSGVATPAAVTTPTGEAIVEVTSDNVPVPHLCDLLEWVDGRPLARVEDPGSLHRESLIAMYRTVGRIAAQIHAHSETWQAPARFVRPRWDREGCLGQNALWGPWSHLDVLEPDERQVLNAAVAVLDRTLERLGQDRQVYGLVHADFVPDNLLEHRGQIVVIDFDDGGYGWYLWELATAVFWYLGTPHYTETLEGYIEGYRTVRRLPDSELELLPTFLLLRALVYMGWMQTRRTQHTARRMTGRVRELSRALAQHVLAGGASYRSIPLELTPLAEKD